MMTFRCKVLEQGDYSVVVKIPETYDSKEKLIKFVKMPQYLCIIAKSLLYFFKVKDRVKSGTTQVMYFDEHIPEELDLVNDLDTSVFLQTPELNIDVLTRMLNKGIDITYESD